MPIVTNNQHRSWLKIFANMKLSSNTSGMRITYEEFTKFQLFMEFDHDSIKSLSKSCSKNIDTIFAGVLNGVVAKNAVPGTNISTISIRRLVVATNSVNYYTVIEKTPDFDNMHFVNVIGGFKTEYNSYVLLKKQTSPKVPLVSDKDKEKKIIKWVPLFEDALSRTFGSNGPLVYIV